MTRNELLERAKPILFNTEMVRAIQDGTKTVTRRVIKPQPKFKLAYTYAGGGRDVRIGKWSYPYENAYKSWGDEFKLPKSITDEDLGKYWTPPCHADDILYVRETWAKISDWIDCDPDCGIFDGYIYKSEWGNDEVEHPSWRPSIHMPKEAARIFLRVTGVHVERLQDCGNMQAKDEGCNCCSQFARIWDSTIKKSDIERYGWNANPWVWVIEFEKVEVAE